MSRRGERKRAAQARVVVEQAGRPAGEGSRRSVRTRRWVTAVVLTVLLLAVAAAAYAVTLAPEHYAKLRAAPADGATAVEVGTGAQLVPERDWVVQPLVRDLVEWPPLPSLKDWSVLFDEQTGVLLLSPDQRLRVEIDVLSGSAEGAALAWLRSESGATGAGSEPSPDAGEAEGAESAGTADPADDPAADPGPAAGAAGTGLPGRPDESQSSAVRTETLASGLDVQHIDAGDLIVAVIDTGSQRVTLRADAGEHSIDRYRPALSALLETISAH
ncbi:hypothetical protein [Leucobacter sp. UCD-THU]|uniref:hypothetical protein n=1 Tax=Leucobacter sp. UCD-THU TaxID=1292023 RepID=UPI0003A2F8D4|nr:hypothetical protein [Leucobacter sp. UCD-THU]